MLIHLNPHDRFAFHSAVAAQDIQFLLNDLNSQLIYNTPNSLVLNPFGVQLLNPIPMGTEGHFVLPYPEIDFDVSLLLDVTMKVKAESTTNGFRIFFLHTDGIFTNATLYLEFDHALTLTCLGITFGPFAKSYPHERRMVMNAAFIDLPTILGYIVTCNSRGRSLVTLGEPREYNVLDNHDSQPVQNLGDVLGVTNPRDNPTGITKRPHERAAHDRTLADGRVVEVQSSIVHVEDYVPSNVPKIIKH